VRCPKCGTINPPEEQLTYCRNCGAELRVVCPRCATDNPSDAEFCSECGLELHPDRGHERAAGIRKGDVSLSGGAAQASSHSTQFIIGGLVIAAVLWIPIFLAWRQKSQLSGCQSHLKHVAVALLLYARDSDGSFPAAENWMPSLLPYLKDAAYLKCPARPARFGYAFNASLSGQKLFLAPGEDAVAFFEAAGDTPNLSGTDMDWLSPPAHSRGNNVAMLSGSVKLLKESPSLGFWNIGVPPAPTPHPGGKGKSLPGEEEMGEEKPQPEGATPPGAAPPSPGGAPGQAGPPAAPAPPAPSAPQAPSGGAPSAPSGPGGPGGPAPAAPVAPAPGAPAPGAPAPGAPRTP